MEEKNIPENNLTLIIKRIREHEVTKLLGIQSMFVTVAGLIWCQWKPACLTHGTFKGVKMALCLCYYFIIVHQTVYECSTLLVGSSQV